MSRRTQDWSSQRCIYILGSVNPDTLRARAAPPKYAMRDNKELAALVNTMVENGQMTSVIMEACGKPEWHLEELTNLALLKFCVLLPKSEPESNYKSFYLRGSGN